MLIETLRTRLREINSCNNASVELLPEFLPILQAIQTPGFYYAEFQKYADDRHKTKRFLLKYLAFQARIPRTTYGLIVEDKNNLNCIGFAEIEDIEMQEGKRQGNLGVFILPAKQRQGFALEVARGMMGWAFSALMLDRIKITIDPANTASKELFTKNFPLEFEGLIDNPYRESDSVEYRESYYLDKSES